MANTAWSTQAVGISFNFKKRDETPTQPPRMCALKTRMPKGKPVTEGQTLHQSSFLGYQRGHDHRQRKQNGGRQSQKGCGGGIVAKVQATPRENDKVLKMDGAEHCPTVSRMYLMLLKLCT